MKNSGGNWNKKGVIKCLLSVIFMIAAIVGFANSKSIMNYAKQFFAAGDVPAHEKTKTDNMINGQKDGTYKLSLTVKGEAEKKVQKANVIVIVDISNSMDDGAGQSSTVYVEDNSTGETRYGVVDGKYVPLTRRNTGSYYNPSYHYYYNNEEYTGTRYRATTGNSRLQATKAAVDNLAQSLLANNGKDGNPADTVEMALVTFATRASTPINETTSAATFTNTVNGLSTAGSWAGATNWEAALTEVNSVNFGAGDNDPTFVIFFSDGAPTVRNTNNGHGDAYGHNYSGIYGSGYEESGGNIQWNNMNWAYEESVDNATTLANKVGADKFFTIFAFGETYGATYMSNLTTAAGASAENNFSASDTSGLQEAFDKILKKIEMSGIGSAVIDDGTTNQVEVSGASTESEIVSLLEIDEDSFEYFKTNPETGEFEKWTKPDTEEALQATVEDGHVIWDLSSEGVLENGVTYKVTFDVYPSQTTYDYIADLENGVIEYSDLPTEVQQYLHQNCTLGTNCSYSLETNTQATLSYDDTRDEAGTQTVGYTNPDPVPTIAETISISKEWDNTIDNRDKHEVKVKLLKSKDDGSGFENFCFTADCDATLNDSNNYKLENISIATGLARLKDGKLTVLDKGHDYKFDELGPESYYWQLETEVVHPMIINGVLTKLILVEDESIVSQMGDATYKEIGGKKYYQLSTGKVYVDAGEGPNIKAENHRRSNLNVTKVVDGPTADPDEKFTFTINVVQKDEEGNVIPSTDTVDHNDYLWFSVVDADGNSVVFDNAPTGWTQAGTSYYAPNETTLSVRLKAGYNLRFFNLHTGSTFDITETDIANYKLDSLTETEKYKETAEGELITNTIKTIKDSNKISGTIDENNRTYTVEAKNIYEKVSAKVKKEWEGDNDGAEGLRKPITFYLKNSKGETVDTVVLDGTVDENGETAVWFGEFEDQTRFVNGEEETYTVEEDLSEIEDHYTSTVSPEDGVANNGLVTVTNTRIPEDITTKVEGTKSWIDGPEDDPTSDQDKLRPESITIYLHADGTEADHTTATKDNGWKYEFDNLPKYKDGELIVYTITEDLVPYYDPEIDGYNITNTHTPFTTEISVTKVWSDANDVDGIRPDEVTVQLYAGELPVNGQRVQLNEGNEWTYTFTKLPRKLAGVDIEYSVKEVPVPQGYTESYKSEEKGTRPQDQSTNFDSKPLWIVTNTHTPETTEVSVEKVWEDADDQDGIRPTSVQVQLYKDGTASGQPKTLDDSNGWKDSWTGLPKYEFEEDGVTGGKEIEYTVKETEVPENYTAEVTGDATEGFTVTNKYTPEETSLKVTKVWDDAGDQDGIRPTSIKVQLTADGTAQGDPVTLDESNNWTYTWTGLAKNKNVQGEVSAITYKADEVTVPQGYDKSTTGDMTTGITITNKYTPKVTNVEGTKTWDDSNNVDGKRPSSITVYVKDGDTIVDTITVTGDATKESWTFKSKDLPKYRNHGKEEIAYTIEEETTGLVEIGYSVKIDGTNITNSRTPEVIEEFPITKSWIDNSNSEGFRPNSVDIQLLADGQPYGDLITIGTDADGNPLEGTTIEGNNWKYVFKNLPKYTQDENGNGGKEIVYSIKEVNLNANYKAEQVDNRTIVNTIDAMKKDIPVKKVWDDASNQDGYRPTSIEFTLTGTVESETEPVYTDTITLNGESDTWEGKFVDAPIFYKGTLITYTINEVVTKDLQTYYPETKEETVEGVYTITNKHVPEVTEVTIGKTWDDKDDQDGKRPASIEVTLTGNGVSYGPVRIGLDENGEPLEGTTVNGNTWTYTFTGLPKKANGKDIEYVVSESNVDNYNQLSIISNVITNQHIPATISYEVEKQWDDFDNQDGKRPEFITVTLTGKVGDTVVYTSTITVKPDENGDWKYAFTGLDKYNKGQLIQYTLTEGNVDLYETDPIVDVPNEEGTTSITNKIINKHELETIDITVKKVWDDLDNKYNHRTTFVTVHLFADGEEVDEAMLTEANGWTTIFEGLVKYREGKVGEEIEYTITEDAVNYYKTSIAESDNVFTITNTYDGPTDSEIVPPKTGILPTKDYTFYELLMNLILLAYLLVGLKRIED